MPCVGFLLDKVCLAVEFKHFFTQEILGLVTCGLNWRFNIVDVICLINHGRRTSIIEY